ncbi:glutathione S-transferase family protein [Paraburkholderia nemoris]|uniref:glutathione S-transferase family protein n=1 Tax=Paraburkholderia nemoris TaxID=2793076 RepID=UPI0038B8512E
MSICGGGFVYQQTHTSQPKTFQAERFLIDALYIASDRFTLADIAAYTSAFAVRQDLDWSKLPLLRAWYARIGARPGVVCGMAAF